jgi:hypothetical protein
MNTLFDVKATVRSIVGDDEGSWTTDGYLVPKINFAYRSQVLYIKRATGANLEKLVEIPNAADANGNPTNQGLTSLAPLQQKDKPLDGLYEPLYLWWKPAGQPDYLYREAIEKKTLPFAWPQVSAFQTQMYFTWRGNQLFVTPVNCAIDLLVDGRFNPPPLVKDQDVLVADPEMEVCVTPATMALIGIESGNPSYTNMATEAEAAADDIVAKIVRGKQGYTARAGSNGRRARGLGWHWW